MEVCQHILTLTEGAMAIQLTQTGAGNTTNRGATRVLQDYPLMLVQISREIGNAPLATDLVYSRHCFFTHALGFAWLNGWRLRRGNGRLGRLRGQDCGSAIGANRPAQVEGSTAMGAWALELGVTRWANHVIRMDTLATTWTLFAFFNALQKRLFFE
jgi:hypothetical protein